MVSDGAERLLEKVRAFVAELDDEERALFAALIAPGIARAHTDAEVAGFAIQWLPDALPQALADALRQSGVRVVGLDE